MIKTVLKAIKIIVFTFIGLFIAFFVLCIILAANDKSKNSKTINISVTATPELLIAPQKATDTVIPTITNTPFVTTQTSTPTKQIKNAHIPIYNNYGEMIGFMDDYTPEPIIPTVTPTSYFDRLYSHPLGCNIKGNVSWRNDNEMIYHCPNWRDYDRTSVDYEDGDRWFCTEQEAIAAGFRKPKNVSAPCIP